MQRRARQKDGNSSDKIARASRRSRLSVRSGRGASRTGRKRKSTSGGHGVPKGRIVGMSKTARGLTERERLTEDLATLERLHALAIRFTGQADLQSVLEEILQAAMKVTHAQKGTI